MIFNKEDAGYEAGGNPSGYLKIEVRDGRGKLTVSVQNLRELQGGYRYVAYLLAENNGRIMPVRIGVLSLTNGKGDIKWEFDSYNVADTKLGIDKFDVAVLLVEDNNKTDGKVICPLAAYRDKKVEWRNGLKRELKAGKNEQGSNIQGQDKVQTSNRENLRENLVESIEKEEEKEIEEKDKEVGQEEESRKGQKEEIREKVKDENKAAELSRRDQEDAGKGIEAREYEEKRKETQEDADKQKEDQKDVDRQKEDQKNAEKGREDGNSTYQIAPDEKAAEIQAALNEGDGGQAVSEVVSNEGVKNEAVNNNVVNNECDMKREGYVSGADHMGFNPCAGCMINPNRNMAEHTNKVEQTEKCEHENLMEMLRVNFNRYFEKYSPFVSKRKDYEWWRVSSPVHLNNIMYQFGIKAPLLFNPAVMMSHFKYRHLIIGIYTDKAKRREFLVCGIPGVYNVDERPFGELCRWVQLEGTRPRYGAFGYWLVFIDPESGKLLAVT